VISDQLSVISKTNGHPQGWPFCVPESPSIHSSPKESCHLERSEAKSKDLRLLLGAHAVRCTLQVSGFYVVPIPAEVDPRGIGLLDQCNLLFAPPSLQLLFACDGVADVLMDFEPDKSVAVVTLSEAVVLLSFVLEDALLQVSGDANVEGMASTRDDIRKIGFFRHEQKDIWLVASPP
jgi:hypothetical protein